MKTKTCCANPAITANQHDPCIDLPFRFGNEVFVKFRRSSFAVNFPLFWFEVPSGFVHLFRKWPSAIQGASR